MDKALDEILTQLIVLLRERDHSANTEILSNTELNPHIIEKLNTINTLLFPQGINYNIVEEKIDLFNDVILKYAQHDYTTRTEITGNDLFDSLAASINFLGEELNYSTITTHYLQDIFNSMQDFLIAVDDNGYIISVNHSLLNRLNCKIEDLLNYNVSKIIPEHIDINNIKNGESINKDHFIISCSGERIPVLINTSSFVRGDNKKIGKVIIARDITAILNYQLQIEHHNILLTEAKNKAEESDKLKTTFLTNLSHEIRTPMNAIVGFSQLLEYEDNSDTSKQYLKIIQQRSFDLLRIIDDILDISKIESGQLKISETEGSLDHFMNDMHNYFIEDNIIMENEEIELKSFVPENLKYLSILTDFDRLKQIFINLIKNALKFTQKGYVEFGVRNENESTLLFYVKDTGVGIPETKKEIIFKPFRQVNELAYRTHEGTGLGLSICKGLLDLMNGTIWVESKEGVGSTFYFTIPLKNSLSPLSD